MIAKLTLSMEDNLIEFAKSFAKTQKTSLSKIVTTYLKSLFQTKAKKSFDLDPKVTQMMGIISKPTTKQKARSEYFEHTLRKHL